VGEVGVFGPTTGRVPSWGEGRSYGICVAKADGTEQRRLPDPEWVNLPPAFRNDGRRIVFVLDDWLGSHTVKRSLWEVTSDGDNVHQLAGSELFDDPLHWRSGQSN
jgi:hypothetical protein